MMVTIKFNKNICAVTVGFMIVLVFCIVEMILPVNEAISTAGKAESVDLPVLMYHHILKTQSRLGDYVISPAQFENDIKELLERGYTPISAAELLSYHKSEGELPKKPVMITFDDGYESVYEYAFPIVKKYNIKIVVSVIGKHTDIFSNPNEPSSVNYAHLSWDQLREMQESGLVEVQNHTYDMHENTGSGRYGIKIKKGESSESYKNAIKRDLGGLNDQIEKELGKRPTVFAYPFGAICKESKPILKELGFGIILTCEEKVNHLSPGGEEPIVLRRYNRAHRYATYEYLKKAGIITS